MECEDECTAQLSRDGVRDIYGEHLVERCEDKAHPNEGLDVGPEQTRSTAITKGVGVRARGQLITCLWRSARLART